MGLSITLLSNDQLKTSVALLDGTGTDSLKLVGAQWGNANWDVSYSGPRGRLGYKPSRSVPQNRVVQLDFRISGASGFDTSSTTLQNVSQIIEYLRYFGGTMTVKHANQNHAQIFDVFDAAIASAAWDNRSEVRGAFSFSLTFHCQPYVRGPSMQVRDVAPTDATFANYTFDSGSSSVISANAAGYWYPLSTGTEVNLIHTGVGYSYNDVQVMARFVPGVQNGTEMGVIAQRVNATHHVAAYITDNGANSTLNLAIRSFSGTWTNTTLATTNLGTRIAVGLPFWVAIRFEGNSIYAEHWDHTTGGPLLSSPATTTTSAALSGGQLATYGEAAVAGQCGIHWKPANANERVDRFSVTPFVYRGNNLSGNLSPGVRRLSGSIPGDTPALGTVEIGGTFPTSLNAFAMAAWSQKPLAYNMVPDGSFETFQPSLGSAVAAQWSTGAVTGVIGAGTGGVVTANGSVFGFNCATYSTPATSGTGASCVMYQPFRLGVTYTASIWVQTVSGASPVKLILGRNADQGVSGSVTPTGAWQQITTTWTPTLNYTDAHLAIVQQSNVASAINIDAAMVYEGTTAPTIPSQINGRGGLPPWGFIDAGMDYRQAIGMTFNASAGSVYPNGHASSISNSAGVWATVVDPALLPTDEHAPTLDIEVWALINQTTTTGAITAYAGSAGVTGGATVYTREYGSAGLSIGIQTGLVRVGTIPLAQVYGADGAARSGALSICLSCVSGAGTMGLGGILLVPSMQRICSPTGKATTGYPYAFSSVNLGGTTATGVVRRWNPDGSGVSFGADPDVAFASPSLGGATIEVPQGNIEFLTAVAKNIPNTGAGTASATFFSTGVALIPTPRWHHFREP